MGKKAQWVLIVAGGILQVPAVRAAQELGYKVLVTDRDSGCCCAALVDSFVALDTFDVEGHKRLVADWFNYGELAAVFTAGADPVVTVTEAARVAGLHGINPDIARICQHKGLTRITLEGYGVPQPRFGIANDAQTILGLIRNQSIAPRIIVKRMIGSGSRGHTVIAPGDDPSEFAGRAYARATENAPGAVVLVEELLSGLVLSVETLWYDGLMIPLNAVERPFDGIVELGHVNPAGLSTTDYDAVWRVMEMAGRALGMDGEPGGHILKGDLILTNAGPRVLELTPRLSGGFDSAWTTPHAFGADYIRGALRLVLGQPLATAMPDFAKRWQHHAACYAVFGPKEGGVIRSIQGIEEAQVYADVILRYGLGDTLPPLTDCTQRVAFCLASHPDRNRAIARAQAAAGGIEVETM
ncbi:MAG: hypothetical protein KKF27_21610 [Gammaproteobacteria bacterium]|nr:hypothetical protein [Gammaproteobacteria bacterium]